ncbi:MAG: hypothetical protein REH79_02225 [Spiroplasma sp.]|nr:hypothetical protein [Spiroplasma sp.]
MSINEIIKKYLPVENQKLSFANKRYNYCSAYNYQNCIKSKETEQIKCTKKLVYQFAKQMNSNRWHLYFLCLNNHFVIRWITINNNIVLVGQIKN